MKHVLAFTAVLLLAACGPSHDQYAAPSHAPERMSDTQLCFALAEDERNPAIRAEMTERDLDCADVLAPHENKIFPERTWRDDVDKITRPAPKP